ncbi:hypothetical protein [Acinetobacter nectaris]|uniref:hypothetical protein n=1 Tax=Acinetobacter nectaris TaxID=1219382 RepID=UPI001F34F22F|nr:hypothetical protein [Acinetobacter nectaris]MCF8999626.1 hypothetical protein [Acinetobacter nectaris]MCF9028180.1 hypothetical protein [Acinetobacter nectaris]MCF9046716.1 hypothetical protein [Acinetobacter nectaris]
MFKPFESDESSSIYDLTLENGSDRVNIYGNLQLTKDQEGLKAAKVLQSLLNELVATLEKEKDLPEKIKIEDAKEVENPFL